MTEREGDGPIRAECAASLATLEANSDNTTAKVDEMYDLLVKNGFISKVAANATAIKWLIRALAVGGAVIGTLAALHLT